jgi:hypothetical protein
MVLELVVDGDGARMEVSGSQRRVTELSAHARRWWFEGFWPLHLTVTVWYTPLVMGLNSLITPSRHFVVTRVSTMTTIAMASQVEWSSTHAMPEGLHGLLASPWVSKLSH